MKKKILGRDSSIGKTQKIVSLLAQIAEAY